MTTFFETKYALNNKIDTGIKINSFNVDEQINNEIFSFNEEGEEYIFSRILSTDIAHNLDYSIRKNIKHDRVDSWIMINNIISTLYAISQLKKEKQNSQSTELLSEALLDSLKENTEALKIPQGFIMNSLYCFLSGINFESIVIKKLCEKDLLDPFFLIKDKKRKDMWNLRREESKTNLDNIYYIAAFCGDSDTLNYLLKKHKIDFKKHNEILNVETCIDIAFDNEWITEKKSIKKMTASNIDKMRTVFEENGFSINEEKENQIIINMFNKNYGLSSFINWNWKFDNDKAIKLLLIKNKLLYKPTIAEFKQNNDITNEIKKVFYNKEKDLKEFLNNISDDNYIQCLYAWMLFTIQDKNFKKYKNNYLAQCYCSILDQEKEYYNEGVEFISEILKPLSYIKELTPEIFERNKIKILDLFKSTLIAELKMDESDKKEILDNVYYIKSINDEIVDKSIFKTIFIIDELVSEMLNQNIIGIKNTKKIRL